MLTPTCDGAVHNSAPAEAEDERRDDTTALKRSTNDNLDSACGE